MIPAAGAMLGKVFGNVGLRRLLAEIAGVGLIKDVAEPAFRNVLSPDTMQRKYASRNDDGVVPDTKTGRMKQRLYGMGQDIGDGVAFGLPGMMLNWNQRELQGAANNALRTGLPPVGPTDLSEQDRIALEGQRRGLRRFSNGSNGNLNGYP